MPEESSVDETNDRQQRMRIRPRHRPEWSLKDIASCLDRFGIDHRLGAIGELISATDLQVNGMSLSTVAVQTGDLYVAAAGSRWHGADFIQEAIAAGANAVLTDPDGANIVNNRLPTLVHPSPRDVLPLLAAEFYEHPSQAFHTVGITGTQGKTTATYLAESAIGQPISAVIGTIGTRIGGVAADSELTTPESPALQALFAVMREEGIHTCAMEVSSHALVQGRVDGFAFNTGVFLNLGRDHLDYHHTMEEYFHAKSRLFTPEHARHAVINQDDVWGQRLIGQTPLPTTTFSVTDHSADWYGDEIRANHHGTSLRIYGPDGFSADMDVRLPGLFNVSNAIAVIAALTSVGHDPYQLVHRIGQAGGVPGRLERIDCGQPYAAFVDYAHKPDAVAAILDALRPLTPGRVIIVLGAGGERDRGKRPIMTIAAAKRADMVIITDDNPRNEDPAVIRAEMLGDIAGALRSRCTEVPGRKEAIAHAVSQAGATDTIVVAGKGHETGQDIAGQVFPFDDRRVLEDTIQQALPGRPQ